MRTVTAWIAAATVLSASLVYAAPPARPRTLTATQFQALQQFQAAPEHQAVREVRATYTTEQEQITEANLITNDITTAATQAGWPAALAILLILGAPL